MTTAAVTAIAMIAALLATAPSANAAPTAAGKIESKLARQFERSDDKPQHFWVLFDSAAQTKAAADIDDWAARGRYVVEKLQAGAAKSQAKALKRLRKAGVPHTSYWITNAIRVEGGSYQLAQQIAGADGASRVVAPVEYNWSEPVTTTPAPQRSAAPNAVVPVEWGIANIKADQVWQRYGIRGDNIVVANIDTGVQYDHPALVNAYRGNNRDGTFSHDYNWFDVTGQSPVPVDVNGHGTHTMGTMVGDDGAANKIGVAPGARWIAANGCCPSDQALLDAAQWMLAPTRIDGSDPDPAMRPHIINNSWGTQVPSNDPFDEAIQQAWADAGIFGVWSNGNNGPNCNTAGSPGSRTLNYSVGATTSADRIANFSSRGPGQDGEIKPNISAPGELVRSAVPGGRYRNMSGTSMAAPHVAGAVALLWSAAPEAVGDLAATRDLLDMTAIDTADAQCGGTAEDNPVYGEGRLDALTLVEARAVGLGTLAGTVTDEASGTPVGGASVEIVGGPADRPVERSMVLGTDGAFRTGLPAGAYTVTTTAYGYERSTVQVTVVVNQTLTRNIPLRQAQMATVSGRVLDGSGQGWPLYAELTIGGYPGGAVFTDPVTGAYSVRLPRSATYNIQIDPLYQGYPTEVDALDVGTSDVRRDFGVTVDPQSCTAPGYGLRGATTTFSGWTGSTPKEGWTVSGSGPWRFDNPRNRQQPPGSSGQFAVADAAHYPRQKVSTTLTSPRIDLRGQTAPVLSVGMRYLGAAQQSGRIEYSSDGRRWTTVWSGTTGRDEGVRTFDLPQAANRNAVQVRFVFTGKGTTFWAVDDVFVGTRECAARPGGLVVGDVRDTASATPVPGARISLSNAPGVVAESYWLLDDPARTGAIYWLFGPAGAQRLTAERTGYQTASHPVTVRAGAVVRQDVALSPR